MRSNCSSFNVTNVALEDCLDSLRCSEESGSELAFYVQVPTAAGIEALLEYAFALTKVYLFTTMDKDSCT